MSLFSQKKTVSLENIWKTYDFYPKSVSGFESMQDGNFYTRLDDDEKHAEINKYSFRSGQKVRTLVNSKDLDIEINNYTFSIKK